MTNNAYSEKETKKLVKLYSSLGTDNLEKIAEEIPPAAAAKQVVTSVKEVRVGSADNTEPPLKPNHPNHRIRTPADAKGMLCPNKACGFPDSSNLPIRAPRKYITIIAAHPPTE